MKKRKARNKVQFCPRGHDTFICGRNKNRECKDCARDYAKKRAKEIKEGIREIQHIKQFCKYGHDTFICGRDKYGECKDCINEYVLEHLEERKQYAIQYNAEHKEESSAYHKQWYDENKDAILARQHEYNEEHRDEINIKSKEYYDAHKDAVLLRTKEYGDLHKEQRRESSKKWAKENPEKRKLIKLQSDEERALRVPKFGQEDIKEFYINKPDWAQGDHKIPLLGDTVSGLHVRWNLQYLTPEENNFKSNKFDGTLENNSWKKDFKEP